jgi:hypothetical protein
VSARKAKARKTRAVRVTGDSPTPWKYLTYRQAAALVDKLREEGSALVPPAPPPGKKPFNPKNVRGFDLTTEAGTKAHMRDHARRKRIAEDFYRSEHAEVHERLDTITRQIMSVMCDLVGREMHETTSEMAKIASEAYLIRIATPKPAEVTP